MKEQLTRNTHLLIICSFKRYFFPKIFNGPESLSEIWSICQTKSSDQRAYPRFGKCEFSRFEKLETSFYKKVSGNCSHTFSLFFALQNLYFPDICSSSNLLSICFFIGGQHNIFNCLIDSSVSWRFCCGSQSDSARFLLG